MSYVIVKNIESDTSYLERDWGLFVLKEQMDNTFDWLNDYYPDKGKEIRRIAVRIWISRGGSKNTFVHISVRNSNVNNIPVFKVLEKTFDFENWYSTKRNQYRMTCGSLGDALKRCLGMGYASWTSGISFDETFEERQWNEPVIIRSNGKEHKIYIKVDWARQKIHAVIQRQEKLTCEIGKDTEIEITLPLANILTDEVNLLSRLERYYQIYKIGKTTIDFSFDRDFQCENGHEHGPYHAQERKGMAR